MKTTAVRNMSLARLEAATLGVPSRPPATTELRRAHHLGGTGTSRLTEVACPRHAGLAEWPGVRHDGEHNVGWMLGSKFAHVLFDDVDQVGFGHVQLDRPLAARQRPAEMPRGTAAGSGRTKRPAQRATRQSSGRGDRRRGEWSLRCARPVRAEGSPGLPGG